MTESLTMDNDCRKSLASTTALPANPGQFGCSSRTVCTAFRLLPTKCLPLASITTMETQASGHFLSAMGVMRCGASRSPLQETIAVAQPRANLLTKVVFGARAMSLTWSRMAAMSLYFLNWVLTSGELLFTNSRRIESRLGARPQAVAEDQVSGTVAVTIVPAPGALCTWSRPPNVASRSDRP